MDDSASNPVNHTDVKSRQYWDERYATEDPWAYRSTPDDRLRVQALLEAIPTSRSYARVLDLGCGNGFVTTSLPGDEVVGVDISEDAIRWARRGVADRADAHRYRFLVHSLFELSRLELGRFDLVVVTGMLYPEIIGHAFSVVREIVRGLLRDGGILASCHIREWEAPRFDFITLSRTSYPYREFEHELVVYEK